MFRCISSFFSWISHLGGTPLVILVDPLTGSIGVEGGALFHAVGDVSGTLNGVSGRDTIVGLEIHSHPLLV